MTGFFGALAEAWDELRVHKLRVLLALIGVAVAVCAITTITAAGDMLRQVSAESNERWSGRPATLNVSAYPTGQEMPGIEEYVAAYDDIVARYEVEHSSMVMWTQTPFRFPSGTLQAQTNAVSADWATMHRFVVDGGRWFTEADEENLSPALVVNQSFLDTLGQRIEDHPTIVIGGENPVLATVVGSYPDSWPGEGPSAYMLVESHLRWASPEALMSSGVPSLELWVPPDTVDVLTEAVRRDLTGAIPGTQVDVNRMDSPDMSMIDGATKWVILGVSAIALLLGGLGLVNIALVTVRYRIREIGIRRSFGASSGRVFFSVLMESVVATVVAGVVGVSLAVVILHNVPLDTLMGSTVQDRPGFPVSAAVTGMVAAVSVGALAGLIPALVAVRVKVIDAIRY
ncbi:ABC transporter permease [Oerskovia enterophila]|uniref:Macrolide export ATP-binding/permease protein MacB n=1 Tax=Oerskovia enterophila TaxID=43678 RepID=A0A163S2Q3_9CELL|nr:ABC transporter permease [Oerskovia enterophila]KZM35954.1 macrolide export ATP-binding/permease protein MacB [Oerskovia enterophila]OCI31347.1 macrolide export ATP-binding/permease protein MacB [Oerskovia enterophila]